jgi:hypothetical protein
MKKMKQPEYREGPEATEAFESGMKALFQVPKEVSEKQPKSKPKARKKRAKKTSGRGASRDSGDEA